MYISAVRIASLACALLACLHPLSSVHAADLTVGGTGAATELLRRLGDAFSKHGEAQVDVRGSDKRLTLRREEPICGPAVDRRQTFQPRRATISRPSC